MASKEGEAPLSSREALCQQACARGLACGDSASGEGKEVTKNAPAIAACVGECASTTPTTYGEKKAFEQAARCVSKASCDEFANCWTAIIEERRAAMR